MAVASLVAFAVFKNGGISDFKLLPHVAPNGSQIGFHT